MHEVQYASHGCFCKCRLCGISLCRAMPTRNSSCAHSTRLPSPRSPKFSSCFGEVMVILYTSITWIEVRCLKAISENQIEQSHGSKGDEAVYSGATKRSGDRVGPKRRKDRESDWTPSKRNQPGAGCPLVRHSTAPSATTAACVPITLCERPSNGSRSTTSSPLTMCVFLGSGHSFSRRDVGYFAAAFVGA